MRCLWLEGNGISQIENLDSLTELRALYLQKNMLRELSNLDALGNLDQLNVSNNSIRSVDGLSGLERLNTLQMAHNRLATLADVQGARMPPISCNLQRSVASTSLHIIHRCTYPLSPRLASLPQSLGPGHLP